MSALLLSVLVPILTDMFKSAAPAVSRKFFGESVDDTIKLANIDIERVKALAGLDNPYGTPDKWVVNLRGSFRYIAAGLLITGGLALAGFGAVVGNPLFVAAGLDLGASPFGFIFGERLVMSYNGKPK